MDIAELEKHGIDARMIAMWSEAGLKTLLPIQVEAIHKGGVLKGNNIVVFSPTSSGKTFVGEMAAARMAYNMERVIYLAPQKALAEEKFREFHEKYGGFGIRTVISTRDRKEFDRDIQNGKFRIAVIVFEKMQTLLVGNPDLLAGVGLVVVDELQMMGDEGRGAGLELLLTKLVQSKKRPQLVGLSAVLGNAASLADWLGATLCQTPQRPVELRKGVLYNGEFHYLEQNSGQEGAEDVAERLPAPDGDQSLLAAVTALVARGEQCLVFRKSRNETITAAAAFAQHLDGASCPRTMERLEYLEDSQGKADLMELLKAGVAFHNADLDWDQRRIIEAGFRSGEIRIVCATSTLALGVNLPCRNVFLDDEKWLGGGVRRPFTTQITQAEYENISGRAGRLGFQNEFGRAMLVADNLMERDALFRRYVQGELGDLKPMLADAPLSRHVLNLVASGLCRKRREIVSILLGSYTGRTIWRDNRPALEQQVEEAVAECLEGGLMAESAGNLKATRAGLHAATKGVDVDTAVAIMEFLRAHQDRPENCELLEVLWALAGVPYAEDKVYLTVKPFEVDGRRYRIRMGEEMERLAPAAAERMAREIAEAADEWSFARRAKKALLALDWIGGTPTREIEEFFDCYSASAASVGGEFSWLAETLAGLAQATGWPAKTVRSFAQLAPRLLYGVGAEGVELAALRLPGLARGRIKMLAAKGWSTLEHLVAAPLEAIRKLITKDVAARLMPMVHRRHRRRLAGDLNVIDAFEEFMPSFDETPPEPWSETYPAADAEGVEYQSEAQVRIVGAAGHSGGDGEGVYSGEYRTSATIKVIGRARTKTHQVIINQREFWLTERSFGVMLVLAVAAKCTDLGWTGALEMGVEPESLYQAIRRMKQSLGKQGLANADELIENNKCKQYRLSTPPRNIDIDEHAVARDFAGGKAMIQRLKKCEKENAD